MSVTKITITPEELRKICEMLLNQVITSGFKQIDLETDYYWDIFMDDREDFNIKPDPVVGSLFDDIEELRRVLRKEIPPTVVDFQRLANVLIAVGEKMSNSKDRLYIET